MSQKELKELEQGGGPVENAELEGGCVLIPEGDGTVSERAESLDLNELLCTMDGGRGPDPGGPDGSAPAGEGEELPIPEEKTGTDIPSEEDAPDGQTAEGGAPISGEEPVEQDDGAPAAAVEAPVPEKPKRASRKKKVPEPVSAPADVSSEETPTEEALAAEEATDASPEEDAGSDPIVFDAEEAEDTAGADPDAIDPVPAPAPATRPRRTSSRAPAEPSVLTIEARADVDTPEDLEEIAWHEIRNAYRTRRMLTGTLGGMEQLENRKTVAVVDYKGFRVVIPLKEMMIILGRAPSGQEYTDLMLRQSKILGSMLGAEVDFIVKGIETKSRSVVASRKDAMLKKRQIFYLDTDDAGMYRVYEGRVIQARVIAVAEKVIRVEAFGVECSIRASDLAWDWIGDAHDRYAVGDQILVRVRKVNRNGLEDISIEADVKSVAGGNNQDNLKKVRVQSKYAGRVTDVHRGVVFIRLSNGVNAIAHSCYDRRMPGKKDDVSFAVTHLDEERGVAMGIITRIIKQNL